jgi:putative phage-type endonuclease
MQIHNFPQYSPEWWSVRSKKLTASKAQAIGNQGAGLKTLVLEIVADHYSSKKQESFSNSHTDRGHEFEPEAAMIYQAETLNDVQEVGFVVYDEYVGCSPDRMVNDDGLLEIKCLSDKVFFQLLLDCKINTKYIWQMQMQMIVCERSWCDFFAYNPNYDPCYFIERICPDPVMVEKLLAGFEVGKKMIDEIDKQYLSRRPA